MTKPIVRFGGALLFVGALATSVWLGARARAQSPAIGPIKDFTSSDYGGPNQDKLKFTITGAEAQAQSFDRYLVKHAKLEVFRETGEREFIVEVPECLYDKSKGTASSPGRLQVQTGDGRFLVEGEGFLWNQSASHLTISNRVRTVIRELPQTKSKP